MDGYRLFYDDHLDAIKAAIDGNAHGLTFKQVACALWPNMKPDSAYARLKNSLRTDKDEKLDLSEIQLLLKITGRADPLFWLCDETSHDRPPRRAKEDKQAELMREFNAHVDKLHSLTRQLEAAGVPILKAVA